MNSSTEADPADLAILEALMYEFTPSEIPATERKIRAKLRKQKLGRYEQERVDLLRMLKNEVHHEISLVYDSRFYLGSRGEYASMQHWDLNTFHQVFRRKYPGVNDALLDYFIPASIDVLYLR